MAERRMFAKTIVLSDEFLDMPLTARCLYFTLGMFADDDGFVNSPKGIMRQCGASQDDMNILISKKFILIFESGVIVIKHWRINNYLRSDRYQSTKYVEEKDQLMVNENGSYSFGIPNSGIPSIDKDSIDKDSIDKDSGDYGIPAFDVQMAFEEFYSHYKKKKNYASCKMNYLTLFRDVNPENYESLANNLTKGMYLFAMNYKDENPDDKDFKYLPSLDVWLKEDALYWIRQAEMESDDD